MRMNFGKFSEMRKKYFSNKLKNNFSYEKCYWDVVKNSFHVTNIMTNDDYDKILDFGEKHRCCLYFVISNDMFVCIITRKKVFENKFSLN